MASLGRTGGPGGLGLDRGLGGARGPVVTTMARFWFSRAWPDELSVVTSLGCSLRQWLLFHKVSSAATRRASRSPAAKIQNTPAKLWRRSARPSGCASAWLCRLQRPFFGHHFCFRMSRSPFSCSSKILQRGKKDWFQTLLALDMHVHVASQQDSRQIHQMQ